MKRLFNLILCAYSINSAACPTCIGRISKDSPSFFEDESYQSPSQSPNDELQQTDDQESIAEGIEDEL